MSNANISVYTHIISNRLKDSLGEGSIQSADIHYRKPVEEFQVWGNDYGDYNYVVCDKNEPCYYEILAYRFPEGLSMLGYCCLTNYAPSQVTNSMMK